MDLLGHFSAHTGKIRKIYPKKISHIFSKKVFLILRENRTPGSLFSPSSKNKKNKKNLPPKKCLMFSQKKVICIFWENGTLIFQEIKLSSPKVLIYLEGTFQVRKNIIR